MNGGLFNIFFCATKVVWMNIINAYGGEWVNDNIFTFKFMNTFYLLF